MIRPAAVSDLPSILDMGERFYATTSYAEFAEYDRDSAERVASILIESGVLLVAERGGELVGMVGLAITPHLFNHNVTTAHEVMWWVEPEARDTGAGIALLRAVTPACEAKGARAVQMIHLANSPKQAAMLYERMGFEHTESSYTRVC